MPPKVYGTEYYWEKMGGWWFVIPAIVCAIATVGVIIYKVFPFLIIPFWVVLAILIISGVALYAIGRTTEELIKSQYD